MAPTAAMGHGGALKLPTAGPGRTRLPNMHFDLKMNYLVMADLEVTPLNYLRFNPIFLAQRALVY